MESFQGPSNRNSTLKGYFLNFKIKESVPGNSQCKKKKHPPTNSNKKNLYLSYGYRQ